MSDHLHAETPRTPRDLKADAAQSQHPQFLAAQFHSLQGFLLPLARMHGGVRFGKLPRQGEHHAQRELGDGNGVGSRRIHHHDAAARGRIGIDVIHAHARAANHAQLWRGGQQCIVDLNRRSDDKSVGIGNLCGKAILDLVMANDLPAGLAFEHGKRSGRNLLRQNDLHSYSSLFC